MSTTSPFPGSRQASDVLADPTRRGIYQFVKRRHEPVSVNQVADEFSMHRNAAKFHLDKLLTAGLLQAEFRRINGRRGPGAGRPSKLYSATEIEVSFSLPERHYEILAMLLLRSLTSGKTLEDVGYEFGAELAEAKRSPGAGRPEVVAAVLQDLGFEPSIEMDEAGSIWITTENCPFRQVALTAPDEEVCKLDRALIRGVLERFGGDVQVRERMSMPHGHDVCVREVVTSSSPKVTVL